MGFLIAFIIVVLIISFLIIASILLQEDKTTSGISMLGGSSQSFFGASSGNILSKFTSVLLAIFLIAGIVIAIMCTQISGGGFTKEKIKEAELLNNEGIITKIDKLTDIKATSSDSSVSSSLGNTTVSSSSESSK